MPTDLPGRYRADITGGALMPRESRIVASLFVDKISASDWKRAIEVDNVLQARNPASAIRIARLIRQRLSLLDEEGWRLIRDGDLTVSTQMLFAAAVMHSALLRDFLLYVVADHMKAYGEVLEKSLWWAYIDDCRGRDPDMPDWSDATLKKLQTRVYRMLEEVGLIDNTRACRLQRVSFAPEVLDYLRTRAESEVLEAICLRQ